MQSDHPSYGRAPESTTTHPPSTGRRTRRDALRLLGAAAAGGAAAGVAAAGHAAADNGVSLTANVTSTTKLTRVDYTGTTPGAAFLFQAGNALPGGISGAPAALAGWSTVDIAPNGVHGFTNQPDGAGVVAVNDSASAGATAIRAVTPARVRQCRLGPAGGPRGLGHLVAEPPPQRRVRLHRLQRRVRCDRQRRDQRHVRQRPALADFVPAGATAIAANVTVTNTVASGFLTVNPGGTVTAATNVIIDVNGYYL